MPFFLCSDGDKEVATDEDDGPAAADAERADEYGGDVSDGEDIDDEEEEKDVDAEDELDDEFVGEDEEGKEETAAEERRRSHSDASASDSEGNGGKGGEGKGTGDNKAASFARAFAKIMATGGTQKGILSVGTSTTIKTLNFFIMCRVYWGILSSSSSCPGVSCSHVVFSMHKCWRVPICIIPFRSEAAMKLRGLSCPSRLK